MWKFHNLSITHISREINFWDYKSAKTAILTHFQALNYDFYVFLHFLKAEIHQIKRIQNFKMPKTADLGLSDYPKIDFT